MPETEFGGVLCGTGDSDASPATDPVSACVHPEFLFEEFALLLPRDEGPTAALAVKRAASGRSSQIVCEVFADTGYLREMERIPATADRLKDARLDDLFVPDDEKAVYPFWLDHDCGLSGLLLVKSELDRDPAELRNAGEEHDLALRYLMLIARDAVRGHETIMMKLMLEHKCPCIAVDHRKRVVFFNRSFSEIMGMKGADLLGADLESILKFGGDRETASSRTTENDGDAPSMPVFVVPLSILINAEVKQINVRTPCGTRTIYAFENLRPDEPITETETCLIHRLTQIALSNEQPVRVVNVMLSSLASALSSNLVCLVRQSGDDELIVTPYSTRRLYSLGSRVLSLENDPVLKPYFEDGTPVICADIQSACHDGSFFKRALAIDGFALIPIDLGGGPRTGVLITWQKAMPESSPLKVMLLSSTANIIGSVLMRAEVLNELEHERDSLRRYTKLVAGREVRMAELKSENAQLKNLIMELSDGSRGQERQ
jgi:hypothetical protein